MKMPMSEDMVSSLHAERSSQNLHVELQSWQVLGSEHIAAL